MRPTGLTVTHSSLRNHIGAGVAVGSGKAGSLANRVFGAGLTGGLLFCVATAGTPTRAVARSAQTAGASAAADRPASAAPASPSGEVPSTKAPATGSPPPVAGVTVFGQRQRCKERDQACIEGVMKEVWTKYPDQVRTWCVASQARIFREGFAMQKMGYSSLEINHSLPPASQALCDYGDKMKAR